MGYLQLAESNPFNALAEVSPNAMKFYVYIPQGYRGATKDMYIREDVLDDLPPATFSQIMYELDEYQNTGLSDAASREARKAQRAQNQADRNERKNTRAQAGAVRQESRTERQRLRSEKKGSGKGFKNILNTVAGTAKDIFGKGNVEVDAGGGDFSVDYSGAPEESFFSRYKIPIILGSVAVIGGGIYLLTRKK